MLGTMTLPERPSFDLSGRVAVVTGGRRGLGRAFVAGLAQAGADVIIASRDGQTCAEYEREITERSGRRALPYAVLVGRWAELDGLAEAAYAEFGHVDVLVNNAGMSPVYGAVTEVSEELFDKVIAVNLKGAFRLTALVGSRMAAGDGGSIINISSAAAARPRAGRIGRGRGRAIRPGRPGCARRSRARRGSRARRSRAGAGPGPA